jgi:hypothetical protein
MKSRASLLILVTLCFIFVFTSSASATPELKLTSDGVVKDIVDNGIFDLDTNPGSISFNGAVGNWLVYTQGGTFGQLNLTSLDTTYYPGNMAQQPPNLIVEFSSEYVGDGSALDLSPAIWGGQPWISSIEYRTYLDNQLIHSSGPMFGMDFNESFPYVATPVGVYTLTQMVIVGHPGNDDRNDYPLTTSFSATLGPSAAPEPSSLILLGSGLIGAALFARRKM